MALLKCSEHWNNDRPAAARILGRARTVEAAKAPQSWILLFSSSHLARSRASFLEGRRSLRPVMLWLKGWKSWKVLSLQLFLRF